MFSAKRRVRDLMGCQMMLSAVQRAEIKHPRNIDFPAAIP